MCVSICIHIYTYIYIYIFIHIFIYINTYIGRPNVETVDLVTMFKEAGIPTSMVLDCAVGAVMDEVRSVSISMFMYM
jgi:hypothetical protein